MRDPQQLIPDHAAILATLGRSVPGPSGAPPPGTVVRVDGTALPGPGGLLTAPLSGRPCVWFRVLEWRHPQWGPLQWNAGYLPAPVLAPVLGSDMALAGPVGGPVDDHESPAPFAVADAHGTTVLVDPVGGDVSTRTVSYDGQQGQWRHGEYVLRREWVVEPGTPVFVLGVADHGADGRPVLHATASDCLVVSTSGEQGVVARAQAAAQYGGPHRTGRLPVGVVIGAGAAVGVVLVVVILVVALLGG